MPADKITIDTRLDGTTTIITEDNVRLELTPKATAELTDHLLAAMRVTITLVPFGRPLTKVEPGSVELARG